MSDDTLKLLMQKLDDHIAETRNAREETKASIKCLRDSFGEFSDKYSTMLEQLIASKLFWDTFRDEALKKGLLVALGIVMLGTLAGMWIWIRTSLGLPPK